MPEGLGQPQPYPMTYFVAWPLALADLFAGGRATLAGFSLVVAGAVQYAGARVAAVLGAGNVAALATGAFFLFNPWTYSRVVAGHLTMPLACAGLALVAAELLERVPDPRRIAFAVLVAAMQTQFILIAFALCALRVRVRSVRVAVLLGLAVFSPTILGIAFGAGTLLSWPLTVAWENSQSVALGRGVLLQGYFTRYADAPFAVFGWWGVLTFVALAVAGVVAVRSRRIAIAAFLGLATLLIAAGTTGPLGVLWRWAIVNAPVVGVYRELYDLIGPVTIAYAVCAAAAMARFSVLRWPALAGALILVAAWVVNPPARMWVAQESLPQPGPQLRAAARYALMPPFQPQSYEGRGAGSDQLFLGTSAANAPLNALLPTYPADAALAAYWLHGDTSELAKLGVDVIECRPAFREIGAAAFVVRTHGRCVSGDTELRDAAPIFGLQTEPGRCSLCSQAGNGNLFIGDAGGPWPLHPVRQPRSAVDPALGWIDARIVYAQRPELGQGLGGAYTSQAATPLEIESGSPKILAAVEGSLRDERGATVTASTGGYHWVRLRGDPRKLYCYGRCLVVGTGDDSGVPLSAPATEAGALPSRIAASWLAEVSLPPQGGGVVRFLENYDPYWIAFGMPGFRPLVHLRLDASINGWRLPARPAPQWMLVVNALAFAQLLAGVAGFSCALVIVARFAMSEASRIRGGVS